MISHLLSFIVLLSLLEKTNAVTITQTLGTIDNFASTSTNREALPQSTILQRCSQFDWRNIPYPNNAPGDMKPMNSPFFDWKPENSPLVWTISNLPTDKLLSNVRIEMVIRGNGSAANDGIGFMWDDNIQSSAPNCKFQYFRRFDTLYSGYSNGVTLTFIWTIPANELCAPSKTILRRIQETGYFHFLVGDDSAVDYFRLTYDYDSSPQNIVSFTCKNYTNRGSLITSSPVYTDDSSYTITSITDSIQTPFTGSSLISTVFGDRSLNQSVFKVEIKSATRFWLFLPQSISLSWVTKGGWELLSGSNIVVTQNSTRTTFLVYTKRYDGPRWVVFGSPSETSTSSRMYFVSFTPSPSLIVVPSNPSASCQCQSTGDPHYITWDNRRFDFYEPGVYYLVKSRDCTFDVQTLTFRFGSAVSVNGIVSVRYLNNTVTLARTPATSTGSAWTGSPVVRLNGRVISSTSSAGGLTATLRNVNEWDISIAAVGLTVKTVVSGNWFHVYPTLSDPSYQRKVDGLCGNCDGNGANDFKFPNCLTAVEGSASRLSSSQAAQWGLSWKVSDQEQIANTSLLSTTTLGSTTWAACLNTPLTQQCPDLVLPEPPKTNGDPVIDPSEPVEFVTCVGSTIITPSNPPIPVAPPDTKPPLLCTDSPKYNQIKSRCSECALVKKYPADDCILDICLSGQEPSTYECPGLDGCINAPTPTQIISSGGFQFATLSDSVVTGVPNSTYCQPVRYRLPPGWEIAPNAALSQTIIGGSPWESACVATSDGASFATSWGRVTTGTCPTDGAVIRTSDGCFNANQCGVRLLIRRAATPVCGNGVKEGTEECDDRNQQSGDGCSPTCTLESPNDWTCDTTITPTICYPVTNIVAEPEYHRCFIDLPDCKGCLITPDNQFSESCCECHVPCC